MLQETPPILPPLGDPMMYLISYDLDEPGSQDYRRIEDGIELLGGKRVLKSQWLLGSRLSAFEIVRKLVPLLDIANDRIVVCELNSNRAALRPIVEIGSL
jgi:hypothetical protein